MSRVDSKASEKEAFYDMLLLQYNIPRKDWAWYKGMPLRDLYYMACELFTNFCMTGNSASKQSCDGLLALYKARGGRKTKVTLH